MEKLTLIQQYYRVNFDTKFMNRRKVLEFRELAGTAIVMSSTINQITTPYIAGYEYERTIGSGESFVTMEFSIEKPIIMADTNCTVYLCLNDSSNVLEEYILGKGEYNLNKFIPMQQMPIGDTDVEYGSAGDVLRLYVSGENGKAVKLNVRFLYMILEDKE